MNAAAERIAALRKREIALAARSGDPHGPQDERLDLLRLQLELIEALDANGLRSVNMDRKFAPWVIPGIPIPGLSIFSESGIKQKEKIE